MIDILIPVLGRPDNAQRVVDSIRAAESLPTLILFLCSKGDQPQIDACYETGEGVHVCQWEAERGDFALKTTRGIALTEQPWIFFGADDLDFTPGWDTAAIYAGKRVVGTQDEGNPSVKKGKHATHFLVDRTYIEEHPVFDEEGAFYSSAYDHQCVDLEALEQAQDLHEYVFCGDSIVRHRHPLWRTAEWDDTYRKGFRNGQADLKLFYTRRKTRLASVQAA